MFLRPALTLAAAGIRGLAARLLWEQPRTLNRSRPVHIEGLAGQAKHVRRTWKGESVTYVPIFRGTVRSRSNNDPADLRRAARCTDSREVKRRRRQIAAGQLRVSP